MTPPRDLRELVGDDVPPEELERLRRVHEALIAAGPPAELPPTLARAPQVAGRLLLFPRRRRSALALVAAAAVAAAFGVGFLVGDRGQTGWTTEFALKMSGTAAAPGALASLAVAPIDESGNWPLLMRVRGLPEQPEGAYYELFLTRRGKPVVSCGTFRVHSGTTVVRLNAPYKLKQFDGWVVTAHRPGRPEVGPVLLTTPATFA